MLSDGKKIGQCHCFGQEDVMVRGGKCLEQEDVLVRGGKSLEQEDVLVR